MKSNQIKPVKNPKQLNKPFQSGITSYCGEIDLSPYMKWGCKCAHLVSIRFSTYIKNYKTEINTNSKINTTHEHLLTEIRFTISKQE